MVKLLEKIILFLLVAPCILQMAGFVNQASFGAMAQEEDDIEGDEDDADSAVETEETSPETPFESTDTLAADPKEAEEKEEEKENSLKPSPDAQTTILFVKPTSQDLPAGHLVKTLIGFYNKGSKDFIVEYAEASIRYPMDFNFYIQNFTVYRYSQTVEPNREASFDYAFVPSETLSSRSFGLVVNLNYKDSEGNMFQEAVFNQTINIVEPDEGLDGETFFLYIFLAAVIVLLFVGAQQLLFSFKKKHMPLKPKQQMVELGTQNNKSDVDYDWLPKDALDNYKKSPKAKTTSPRSRTSKRKNNSASDE